MMLGCTLFMKITVAEFFLFFDYSHDVSFYTRIFFSWGSRLLIKKKFDEFFITLRSSFEMSHCMLM